LICEMDELMDELSSEIRAAGWIFTISCSAKFHLELAEIQVNTRDNN
jgi:hypothetical protein